MTRLIFPARQRASEAASDGGQGAAGGVVQLSTPPKRFLEVYSYFGTLKL